MIRFFLAAIAVLLATASAQAADVRLSVTRLPTPAPPDSSIMHGNQAEADW